MFRITESVGLKTPVLNKIGLTKVTEALSNGSPALQVKISAIHEGLTRNNTFYSKEGLTGKVKNDQNQISGLESWTKPYGAPIVKDHEATADNVIGRVASSAWVEKAGGVPGHVEITANITDPTAIEKFIRGEYSTGSIGMDVDTAHCSICSENLKEADFGGAFHEHQRGKWYKKGDRGSDSAEIWTEAKAHDKGARRAHVNIGNVWAREYSVVAVPSDMRSKVKSFEVVEMELKKEGEEAINLLDASFKESTTTPTLDINDNQPSTEETESKNKSVAELFQENRSAIEVDPLSFYLSMLIDSSNAENTELANYIFNNNEHLEAELNEIKEAVLSTENNKNLPDSCFALVKEVDKKQLRALPYKKVDGSLEKAGLRTALTRWNQITTFDEAERLVGLRKLRAAAIKAGLVETAEAQDIEEAKAIIESHGLKAYTAEELETLKATFTDTSLTTQLETVQDELDEANRILVEREAEADELLDTITELKEESKAKLVDEILTLQNITEDEIEVKKAELVTKTNEYLEETHKNLFKETHEKIIVTTRASKSGIGVGSTGSEQTNSLENITEEMILSAKLGNKRDQQKILEAVRKAS